DRGSGSVPAFLAAELGAAQALGLVSLSADAASDGAASDGAASDGAVLAERRLDRGARERLRVPLPAVCSVEGASARLRRAALPVRTGPFRPRARALPAPASPSARERVLELTGALSHREPPQTLYLEPAV